jgi:ribosome-associated translation inhibitor RaiA
VENFAAVANKSPSANKEPGVMDHVQITYRNLSASPATDEQIHERVNWLTRFYPRIVGCHVVIEVPHRHHRHGAGVHVRLQVMIPGDDVIVNHEPAVSVNVKEDGSAEPDSEKRRTQQEVEAAIHGAFDVARRQLEEGAQRQRDAKRHSPA